MLVETAGCPLEAGGRIWPDSMDHADLKRIMDWAAKAPIREIEVIESDVRIHLVKDAAIPTQATPVPPEPAECVVAAPLPGRFYLEASPEAAPFVAVGLRIKAGDTVGLIEAMKMFSPVTTEVDGIIEAILVEPGQEVEIGQPLVRLRRDRGTST